MRNSSPTSVSPLWRLGACDTVSPLQHQHRNTFPVTCWEEAPPRTEPSSTSGASGPRRPGGSGLPGAVCAQESFRRKGMGAMACAVLSAEPRENTEEKVHRCWRSTKHKSGGVPRRFSIETTCPVHGKPANHPTSNFHGQRRLVRTAVPRRLFGHHMHSGPVRCQF